MICMWNIWIMFWVLEPARSAVDDKLGIQQAAV